MSQTALFAEDELPSHPSYDVGAVRERLQGMLGKMRAAASWPLESCDRQPLSRNPLAVAAQQPP